MTTSQHIPYNYTWKIYGKNQTITRSETDAYNRYTNEIERATADAKEFLLDMRHKFIVACLTEKNE